jgi:hypothetical protein
VVLPDSRMVPRLRIRVNAKAKAVSSHRSPKLGLRPAQLATEPRREAGLLGLRWLDTAFEQALHAQESQA